MSPDNYKNLNKSDFLTNISEEINLFTTKGNVLIQGDLNARTGNERDFIKHDKSDKNFGIENFENQPLRNSEDKITLNEIKFITTNFNYRV